MLTEIGMTSGVEVVANDTSRRLHEGHALLCDEVEGRLNGARCRKNCMSGIPCGGWHPRPTYLFLDGGKRNGSGAASPSLEWKRVVVSPILFDDPPSSVWSLVRHVRFKCDTQRVMGTEMKQATPLNRTTPRRDGFTA